MEATMAMKSIVFGSFHVGAVCLAPGPRPWYIPLSPMWSRPPCRPQPGHHLHPLSPTLRAPDGSWQRVQGWLESAGRRH